MDKMMNDEEFQAVLSKANEISMTMAKTLITMSEGQGPIITAAMAMLMAGLERQHKGTIKDVMSGAVLLGITEDEVSGIVPPDNMLN